MGTLRAQQKRHSRCEIAPRSGLHNVDLTLPEGGRGQHFFGHQRSQGRLEGCNRI